MADMHVLEGGGDGLSWKLAMHFAVPDTTNAVSVNHRTALVNSGVGGTTLLVEGAGPGQVSTAEKAQIESGAIYEHVVSYRVESGGTTTLERRNALRDFYATEKARILNVLQSRLRYYGHTESET